MDRLPVPTSRYTRPIS